MLSSKVVTRGTARYRLPRSVSIVPSTLKLNAGVISKFPEPATQLKEGDVILVASGRPVFAFQGEIPAYRDFVAGVSGGDVRQLKSSLKRLGFDPGPIEGPYDEDTAAAVANWYSSAGWQPFGATPEQRANIRALEKELAVANRNKLAAADARAAAPGIVAAARAKVERANKGAAANVAAKRAVRDLAIADQTTTEQKRAKAEVELDLAEVAARATQLAGKVEIQAAINAQRVALREAKFAEEAAARLAADLESTRRKAGIQVPADEVVFFPVLPVRVEQVNVALGDAASGKVMSVTNNQLAIDSSLSLDEAPLVKPGMAVAIDESALGIEASGVVAGVANTPGTNGVDGYHIYFEVLVEKTHAALEGLSLRVTIPIKSTEGAVTAVPISALSQTADGTSRVQVENNGALEFVVVKPGLSADGFVEVTPVDGTLAPGQLVVVGYEKSGLP